MVASRMCRLGGRLTLAAVLCSTLFPLAAAAAGAAVPVAAAMPRAVEATKAASSWKAERTEEFSGSKLPDGCGSYSGKYAAGKSGWSGKEVKVDDGLLTLSLRKKKVAGQPYSSGGVGCWGWAQRYGKFEVKAKVPAGKGIDSYLTLWPTKGGAGAWTGIELLAPGPDTAYVTNGYGAESEGARVVGNYAGEFHTYVIEWAPKHLRMTVDGKEIFYSDRAYKGSRYLGLVMSNGDALTGVPGSTTKLPAAFQIDRVKTWSYTGVPPKPRFGAMAPSRSRVAGVPTPLPTSSPPTVGATVPAITPTPVGSALAAASSQAAGPSLTGGVWPWLLGGSLIAVFAVASLNYPHHRRAKKAGEPHDR